MSISQFISRVRCFSHCAVNLETRPRVNEKKPKKQQWICLTSLVTILAMHFGENYWTGDLDDGRRYSTILHDNEPGMLIIPLLPPPAVPRFTLANIKLLRHLTFSPRLSFRHYHSTISYEILLVSATAIFFSHSSVYLHTSFTHSHTHTHTDTSLT